MPPSTRRSRSDDQKSRIRRLAIATLLATAHGGACAQDAFVSSGSGNYCRPALPAFDRRIRTRPLAVQNESGATAFVSCSVAMDQWFEPIRMDTSDIRMGFVNHGSTSIVIACTGVSGRERGPNRFVTRSTTLQPGQSRSISWRGDFAEGGLMPGFMSFSCALPPGGAITEIENELVELF